MGILLHSQLYSLCVKGSCGIQKNYYVKFIELRLTVIKPAHVLCDLKQDRAQANLQSCPVTNGKQLAGSNHTHLS